MAISKEWRYEFFRTKATIGGVGRIVTALLDKYTKEPSQIKGWLSRGTRRAVRKHCSDVWFGKVVRKWIQ